MNRGCALERVNHNYVCTFASGYAWECKRCEVEGMYALNTKAEVSVRTCLAHQILAHKQRTYQHKTHCSYCSGVAHTSATCTSSELLRVYGRTA
eukprot:935264-Pleurochrysis_carterae.AAC.1